MAKRIIEILVGLFMLFAIVALVFMALKVSGLANYSGKQDYYKVYAEFDNIGSLKVRSPVMISGVSIGEVGDIKLNHQTFRAAVTLLIYKSEKEIPVDTSANIYTQGILGSNYISLTPGYESTYLKNGDTIGMTNSAIILEKLIGQFLYSFQNKPAAVTSSSVSSSAATDLTPAKNGQQQSAPAQTATQSPAPTQLQPTK